MNILNRRYVVSVLGRSFRVGFFKMVFAYCYHTYKDALSHSSTPSFRIIGSYVSVC